MPTLNFGEFGKQMYTYSRSMSSVELLTLASIDFSCMVFSRYVGFPDMDTPKDVRIFSTLFARAVITVSQTT